LIDDPAPGLVRYCAGALGVDDNEYRKAYKIFADDFQMGRSSEEQFWANMTAELKVSRPKNKSLWGEAFAAVYRPKAEMFDTARQLRESGYKVALLSNTERPAVEFFNRQRYDLFDAVVFSCLEGTKKPEGKIYEITLKNLSARPEETVFIDDSEEHINGAKQTGLATIVFGGIRQLKEELSRLGIRTHWV